MGLTTMQEKYDIIVIGAGHAGCEAALAAARMGARTLLLTLNMDMIALMPCNPSIGGPAKGNIVSEIDALGGEMATCIDKTFIQIRMLNASKGPAVRALRAQADKKNYGIEMKRTLETQKNLTLKQALVTELLVETNPPTPLCERGKQPHQIPFAKGDTGDCTGQCYRVTGVVTNTGWRYLAQAVVLAGGTSLNARIIIGDLNYSGGRSGELPAADFSESLRKLGIKLARWKTGTPPRIDAKTINYNHSLLDLQPGSETPMHFSWQFQHDEELATRYTRAPEDICPSYQPLLQHTWREQLPCHLIWATEETNQIVRENLDRAPLFSGIIEGIGPRYCPSFEAKVANFPDKRQQLFLEPEGWKTTEVYLQGANTSLPEDVQLAMVRSMPGLEAADIVRVGYAIEYDGIASGQLTETLELKQISGFYSAGQPNGTSGYEEAAAQGFLAGVNAVLKLRGETPLVLGRDEAYMGVLVDDILTREIIEPYRMLTSRAEYRLLLRYDNADMRLTEHGHRIGLISTERYQAFLEKKDRIAEYLKKAHREKVKLSGEGKSIPWSAFLSRPGIGFSDLETLVPELASLPAEVKDQVTTECKYEGYIAKQRDLVAKFHQLEDKPIPSWVDFSTIPGLRNEARERLLHFAPTSVGQASRLFGVTPADVSILLVWMERKK